MTEQVLKVTAWTHPAAGRRRLVRRRGMSMIGTVVALAAMAVLTVAAAGAAFQLSGGAASGGDVTKTSTDLNAANSGTVAPTPGGVAGAAKGVVLLSHADGIQRELSAIAAMGEPVERTDVDSVLSKYPQTVEQTTVTATAAGWEADHTIRVSDGSATVCIVAEGTSVTSGSC